MALELQSTFVVLKPDQRAALVGWSSWEMHPAGHELVCLLSGDVEMVIEQDGGEEVTRLREAGSCLIVPKGAWHTARTRVATAMLFVTPGQDTRHRPLQP